MQGLGELLASKGADLGSLGGRFGLAPGQTRAALASLAPAVLGGFQKTDIEEHALAAEAVSALDPPEAEAGNNILGQIFGSKDVSRTVADHAAGQSDVSSTILRAMLPIVAAMVPRHFAGTSDAGGSGGLGGMFGAILGGGSGGLGGLLGAGTGNPLDQILGCLR